MTEFVKRHPHVRVDLSLLDRIVDLVDEGLHLGVRIGRLPDSSLLTVPVGEVRRVVVASPDCLARNGEPDHPAELTSLPCVAHIGAGPTGRWRFREAGQDRLIRIDSRFSCNLASTSVEACVSGLGFGSFLSYQVEREVRAGRLRVVLEADEPDSLPVQIVYPDARFMSPRLRIFIDALREHLRGRPEIHRRTATRSR